MVFLFPFSDYTILQQNLLQIHIVFRSGAERVQHFSVLVMSPRMRTAYSLVFSIKYVRQAHKRPGLRKNDCQRSFHQAKEIEEGRGERGKRNFFIYFPSCTHMNYVYVKLSPPPPPPQCWQQCYAKAALCSMRMRRIN